MKMTFRFLAWVVALPLMHTSTAVAGDISRWISIGQTGAGCGFATHLAILDGYPFARITVTDGNGRDTVVALAQRTLFACDAITLGQVPEPAMPPTYEVLGSELCFGRLPTYTVTRSLSGISETCQILP